LVATYRDVRTHPAASVVVLANGLIKTFWNSATLSPSYIEAPFVIGIDDYLRRFL
jgi:hypothetical protein